MLYFYLLKILFQTYCAAILQPLQLLVYRLQKLMQGYPENLFQTVLSLMRLVMQHRFQAAEQTLHQVLLLQNILFLLRQKVLYGLYLVSSLKQQLFLYSRVVFLLFWVVQRPTPTITKINIPIQINFLPLNISMLILSFLKLKLNQPAAGSQ